MSDGITSAIIATVTALSVTLLKDVVVEGFRRRRQAQLQLLDRKLKDLYSPLFVTLGGGEYPISYIFSNDYSYAKLTENYHLLSSDLRSIMEECLTLTTGPNPRDFQLRGSCQQKYFELSKEFARILKSEIDELREQYLRCSEGMISQFVSFWREQMQQS